MPKHPHPAPPPPPSKIRLTGLPLEIAFDLKLITIVGHGLTWQTPKR